MRSFFALLRLQLLSRYADMKPRNIRTAMKEKKGRTVGKAILTVFLVIYLGSMLFIFENKLLDVLIEVKMPDLLISMVTLLASAGTLLLSFFFVISVMYLGRDAAYLAALPLKPRTVMSAKLAQVWISETCIDAVIILPACILYGLKTGTEAGFYLRLVPVWLLISLLPICIICFLSTLLIRLSALWKHREIMMTVLGIALLVGYMFLMMNLGSLTGDSASGGEAMTKFVMDNHGRIGMISQWFPPAGWAANGLLGRDYGTFAVWILLSLAAPVITVGLLGFSYRKLSLMQSEAPAGGKKKLTGKESYGSGSQLAACCRRELRSILRVPSYAMNILPVSFMPLLMVIMMSVIMRRVSGTEGETILAMLRQLDPTIVMGILAVVMAYMAGMNPALSTAVSREGKGHDFLTALPVSPKTLILAKFIVGFGLALAGVAAASIVMIVMFPVFFREILMAMALCVLFSFANSVIALNRDIRKPRLDWVTEQEAVKQNFGVLISMLLSWGMLIALAGLTVLLVTAGLGILPVFGILAAVLAVLCALLWRRLGRVTEKYYCAG